MKITQKNKLAVLVALACSSYSFAAVISDADLLSAAGGSPLTLTNGTDTVILSITGAHAPDLVSFTSLTNVTYVASPGDVDTASESFTISLSSATVSLFNLGLNIGAVQNTIEQWTIASDGTIAHSDSEGTFVAGTGVYDDNSSPHVFGAFTFTGATSITLTTDGVGFGNTQGITGFEIEGFDLVPEPSSAALLGLGGLALISRRKRA